MARIEGSFDQIDRRLGRIEGQIDRLDGRIDRLEGRIDRLDARMDRLMYWQLGLMGAIAVSILATVLTRLL